MSPATPALASPARPRSRLGGIELLVVVALAVLAGAAPAAGASPLLLPGALVLAIVVPRLLAAPETALAVAVVVVLLPAGLLPGLAQSSLDVAALLVAAAAAALAARGRAGPGAVPLAVWLLLVFVVCAVLSLLWTTQVAAGADLVRRYALALLLLVVVVVRSEDRRTPEQVLTALAVVGWLLCATGLYALLTGSYSADDRLVVLDMNENQYGNALLLATPGVLWLAVAPRRASPLRTAQAAAFLLTALVLIAQTGSRGSLVAYALLVLAFLATRTLRRWGAVALAAGVALLVLTPALYGSALDRLRTDDLDELARTTLWVSAAAVIADHPFGLGLGEAPHALPEYIAARDSRDRLGARDTIVAHNPLLEVGADTGVVGLLAYASMMAVAALAFTRAMLHARRTDNEFWTAYGAVVGAGSLAFLAVWSKSGGESHSFSTFVLLALWLSGTRAYQVELAARRASGAGRTSA